LLALKIFLQEDMNNIFESLLIEKSDEFKNSFSITSCRLFYDEENKKLIHTGEFGTYREAIVKKFIRFFIPARLEINTGFIITNRNDISTQCDIIIFDANSTPLIETGDLQRFFPIETVCGIGEIKSTLSKSDFKKSINKLAKIKSLRENIKTPIPIRREKKGRFDPENYAYDQVPSFLICQKLDFDISNIVSEINQLYDQNIQYRHRHNLILSIEDGILLYFDSNKKSLMHPSYKKGSNLPNRFTSPANNPYVHFKLFCSYLFMMTSSCTVLFPDITDYMGSITGGTNLDGNLITG
jgi:hypothetical protein